MTTTLRDHATLLASIPGLLGFTPEHSIVLLHALPTGRLGPVARIGIDADPDPIECVAEVCTQATARGYETLIAVIVSSGSTTHLLERLYIALDATPCRLIDIITIDVLEEGRPWRSHVLDPDATGYLPDPALSTMSMHSIVTGGRPRASRQQLHDELSATQEIEVEPLAQAVRSWILQPNDDAPAARAALVSRVVEAIEKYPQRREWPEELLTDLACGLADVDGIDAFSGLAVVLDNASVASLWQWAAARLPAPWRYDALVLLAMTDFAFGNAIRAAIACDIVLAERPKHRRALLVREALRAFVPPRSLRDILKASADHAAATIETFPVAPVTPAGGGISATPANSVGSSRTRLARRSGRGPRGVGCTPKRRQQSS